ncbi:MAG TPA: hypothetical protein VGG56_07525 [Terracidiphilus sp.]|jgi:hypothetical protein
MSDPDRELQGQVPAPHRVEERVEEQAEEEEPQSPGPNLAVIYSLIALALAAAIGFALMIVMPFYNRR